MKIYRATPDGNLLFEKLEQCFIKQLFQTGETVVCRANLMGYITSDLNIIPCDQDYDNMEIFNGTKWAPGRFIAGDDNHVEYK